MKTWITILVAILLPLAPLWAQENIVVAEYYVDTDAGLGQNTTIPLDAVSSNVTQSFNVNLSGVATGLHTLGVRTKDATGTWSLVTNRAFLVAEVIPTDDGIIAAEYFVDEDAGFGNNQSVVLSGLGTDVNASFSVDITSYAPGIHVLYVRVKDVGGRWSIASHQPFVVIRSELTNIVALEYYYYDVAEASVVGGDTYTYQFPEPQASINESFVANVEALTSGKDYVLYVLAINEAGRRSLVSTESFLYCNNTDGSCVSPVTITSAAVTNIGCDNNRRGQVTINAAGGTGSYEYSLSTDSANYTTNNVFNDLVEGTYTAYARDGRTVASQEFTITTAVPLSATISILNNSDCTGEPNGAFEVFASGGSGNPFQYSLNSVDFQSSGIFSGLAAGTYTVTVRSEGSCDAQASVNVPIDGIGIPTPQISRSNDSDNADALFLIANDVPDIATIQWYRNDAPLAGETNDSLAVSQEGTYHVVVSVGGCSVRSSPTQGAGIVTSLAEAPIEAVAMYPNPAQTSLTLEVPLSLRADEITVHILSSQGKLLKERQLVRMEESHQLDLSTLSAGLYVIAMRGRNFYVRRKIMKE